jgi:hypothetical protein
MLTRLRLFHLQPASHPIATDKARLLENDVAISKNHKVRDALDSKSSRKLRICFCIDLQHESLARHLLRQSVYLRGRSAAWATPGGPKVHQDRNARFPADLFESGCVNLNRLIGRRQSGFALAATSCVGQMLRRNSILRSTITASPYRRVAHDPAPNQFQLNAGSGFDSLFVT